MTDIGVPILPAGDGVYDFVSLGALVHRLDSGILPVRKAKDFKIHVSGGEFNCSANLSDCFKLKTAIVSAMSDYPIGHMIQERVKSMGVEAYYKTYEHDGVHGPNMATVFSDRGGGVRAPVVFYNRCNEAAQQLKPGDFDWDKILGGGCRWFHSGGIFAALSTTTADVILEGMRAAKAKGAIISFDLNYRAKLWNIVGGLERAQVRRRVVDIFPVASSQCSFPHAPIPRKDANVIVPLSQSAHAQEICGEIASLCDVIVGNEEDLQLGLGVPGADVEKQSKLDPAAFFGMIDNVKAKFPNVKVIATTLREVHTTNRHTWSAVAWINGQTYVAPQAELDVYDRVGGGDGFGE